MRRSRRAGSASGTPSSGAYRFFSDRPVFLAGRRIALGMCSHLCLSRGRRRGSRTAHGSRAGSESRVERSWTHAGCPIFGGDERPRPRMGHQTIQQREEDGSPVSRAWGRFLPGRHQSYPCERFLLLAARKFQCRVRGQKVHERDEGLPLSSRRRTWHPPRRRGAKHAGWGSNSRRQVGGSKKEALGSQDQGSSIRWTASQFFRPSPGHADIRDFEKRKVVVPSEAGGPRGAELRQRASGEEEEAPQATGVNNWECIGRCRGKAEFRRKQQCWVVEPSTDVGRCLQPGWQTEEVEEEKAKKEKEEEGFRWVFVRIQYKRKQFISPQAAFTEEGGEETGIGFEAPHGSCEGCPIGHEPSGRRRRWTSRSCYIFCPGPILLPDPGKASSSGPPQGRKRALQSGSGHRHPTGRGYPTAGGHAGGKVSRCGDSSPGRLWETAKWLEVSRLEDRGAASSDILLAARKHQRVIDRASGRGSFSRSYDQYWASGHGEWTDAPTGRGKGKHGKKGKGKGKKSKNSKKSQSDPWWTGGNPEKDQKDPEGAK